ncbi:MAG TPA: hypothetical protein VFC09_05735 [Candidatus Dormibacteraeota bacterium]|nr:hypothetical protein [Candidatus Dormibacteraeota bacterium]
MGIDVDERMMGRVLHLPISSVPGEGMALRAEVVGALQERRSSLVDAMSAAVRRAGLASLLEVGDVALERRLDGAARVALSVWTHSRPLEGAELEAVRRLGRAVGCTGAPLWRLLSAVQHATRAGWEHAVEQALAVVEESCRPRLAARLVAELSLETMELAGRVQAQLAAGYGEVVPPRGRMEPQGSTRG